MADSPQCDASAAAVERAWLVLVELLGTTATAALVRRSARAARVARPHVPAYAELDVVGAGLGYTCVAPASWRVASPAAEEELHFWLDRALCPLLRELAGPVLVGVLARDPILSSYLTRPAAESLDE